MRVPFACGGIASSWPVTDHQVSQLHPSTFRARLLTVCSVNVSCISAQALRINVAEILNDYGIYAMFHELLREAGKWRSNAFTPPPPAVMPCSRNGGIRCVGACSQPMWSNHGTCTTTKFRTSSSATALPPQGCHSRKPTNPANAPAFPLTRIRAGKFRPIALVRRAHDNGAYCRLHDVPVR